MIQWDPIGLLPKGEIWDHKNFADEYDSYLLEVAGNSVAIGVWKMPLNSWSRLRAFIWG